MRRPNRSSGAPITTAADVYALGVMLYELLTGERPYKLKRGLRGALEEAILAAEPVAPSRAALAMRRRQAPRHDGKKLSKILRGDLDTIAAKALKKSPTERYATANAFGEDIARFLRGDVVLAQPDSVAYRALKFARRHRVGIAAAGVLLLTLARRAGRHDLRSKGGIGTAGCGAASPVALAHADRRRAREGCGYSGGTWAMILEVLPRRGSKQPYTPEASACSRRRARPTRSSGDRRDTRTGCGPRPSLPTALESSRRLTTKPRASGTRATGREIGSLIGHTDRSDLGRVLARRHAHRDGLRGQDGPRLGCGDGSRNRGADAGTRIG